MANLEYLKNVLLQFIFLRSGSERQALLPVIHTMLQLSPEEKSKLAAIAQGMKHLCRSEEKHCRIVKKVYHITYKHKICKYWLEICDCRSNFLWTAIISTLFLSRPSLISFVQVKKRGLGLGAQAGPPISTAGLGSDRLDDQPTQQKIYIYI